MGHDLLLRAGHREVGAKPAAVENRNEENQMRIDYVSDPTGEGVSGRE